MLTAKVNGREMRASEIAKLIEERTGQRITSHAVRIRINRGITGKALLAAPNKGWRKGLEGAHVRRSQKLVRVDIPGWGVRTG